MKILFCSDIHGDLESLEKVLQRADAENAEKIVMLGDLLYHGPRNDLPPTYAPKSVIELLNKNKKMILSVRGNCDTEVDQMVLEFPILADYAYLCQDGLNMLITHGHRYNTKTPPPMLPGEILIHGHTHILTIEGFAENNFYINPGSAAIPKGGNPRSYMIYENRCFTIKTLDGEEIISKQF
jgi:putative phosphoesterase